MFYLPTVSSYPHLTFSVGKTKSKLGYPVVPIQILKKKENPGINLNCWKDREVPEPKAGEDEAQDPLPHPKSVTE